MELPPEVLPEWPFVPIWSSTPIKTQGHLIHLFFFSLGILAFIYLLFKLFLYIKNTITSWICQHTFLQNYGVGSWAVIVGANDPIGKEFSRQLAQRGFNIVLISKYPLGLSDLQDELQRSYPSIRVKTILKEFSEDLKDNYFEDIEDQLKNYDISLLVNNIEVSLINKDLHECSSQELNEMILRNFLPQLTMAKAIMPKLSRRSHQSAILNISFGINEAPMGDIVGNITEVFNDFLSGLFSVKYPNTKWASFRFSPIGKIESDKSKIGRHERFQAHNFVRRALKKLAKKKPVI